MDSRWSSGSSNAAASSGPGTCPTDDAALTLDGGGEAAQGEGAHVLARAVVRLS